jgi:hypothetical protein
VLARVRSIADSDLSHVFLADPHYVSVDAPAALEGPAARRFLDALAHRRIHLVARGIENAGPPGGSRAPRASSSCKDSTSAVPDYPTER